MERNLKITTWNVNSIRARISNLKEFLKEHQPDVLLLQEIKCEEKNFPYSELEEFGYNIVIHGQKSFNGVAILSKFIIEEHHVNLINNPKEEQSRFIEAIINYNGKIIRIASVYVPNGESLTSEKFEFKLKFLEALKEHIRKTLEWNELFIIGGDYNIAPEPIDIYDPVAWGDAVLFSIKERKLMQKILNTGIKDSFRLIYPNKQEFSWWDYRGSSLKNDEGVRIDHILVSPEAADKVSNIIFHKDERFKPTPSDHIPVTLLLNI